eukprot:TRINITY_DN6388_c0_g1_i3.p1 TRINITY_DN6388_c0_g1~~TRINITY_DN6388_c0_g1_i3.p1  ORF type:complete len:329 (-),score=75.31 TRINITY_DN6388_c0_g1_i3:135-1121(-)
MTELRDVWEATSFELEKRQANIKCVLEEQSGLAQRSAPIYHQSWNEGFDDIPLQLPRGGPRVAVIREEGSNGDREMAAAFFLAGFEVWDVNMTDLSCGKISLSEFVGVAFVGGFSQADVFDSAKGWAGSIRFNRQLLSEFDSFYERKNTFSLGICNGCQLMALLGWVPFKNLDTLRQVRFISNQSGRFESRFVSVKIVDSPAIMLKGMAGSVLGVWSSHGEGRAHFPDSQVLMDTLKCKLAPIRYVDDGNDPTQSYPFNPNGSVDGIAGLCSLDGRHFCLMPHPDRSFLNWQWPWMPTEWKEKISVSGETRSPWFKMFRNAWQWVMSQ